MGTLSYEFMRAQLSGAQKARADSYVNSPLYYMITGRKGAKLYKSHQSALVVCAHPHVEDRLLVFPEIGKADYELTASVLNMLDVPRNGIQLARFSEEEIMTLRRRLAERNYSPVTGVTVIEEDQMDWRYPVHILDTEKVAAMEGADFKQIRKKFKKAAEHISHVPLEQKNALRLMRAVLKFWEGNMIFNEKDTEDMGDFYHELFAIMEKYPETINGLFYLKGRKPLGFAVWDKTTDKAANMFVNLGDTSIPGLSDYQMVTTCQALSEQGFKRVNLGGSEIQSLDAFKAKYMPAESLKILSAEVSYRKPDNVNVEVYDIVS